MALSLPVAVVSGNTAIVGLWACIVVLLILFDVVVAPSPRRLIVTRDVPINSRLGTPAQGSVSILNPSRRAARGILRDAWQPAAGAHTASPRFTIAPGQGQRIITAFMPRRRGKLSAGPVIIRTFGPLRFAGRQARHDAPAYLRILPEFASRRHLPSRLARLREMDGQAAVQIRGEGTEFDSLREYVIGDDVRSIDWRGTARRSEVVVRTWRPERDRRVLIVLDTGRTSAINIDNAPRLETSIEATLLLAALASSAGDRIDVIAVDRDVNARVHAQTGAQLMASLALELSDAWPRLVETDWTRITSEVRRISPQRSLVVILTADDPGAVATGLLPVVGHLTQRHLVVIASVDDPTVTELTVSLETAESVYDAAAARQVQLERHATTAMLQSAGADVLHASPDELAPRLADRYLQLKAAGRL